MLRSDRSVAAGTDRSGLAAADGPVGNESAAVIFRRPDGSPIFAAMETEMGTTEHKPLPKAQLLPAHLKALREAKLDINFRTRADEKEQDILHRFFEEAFPEWLKRALADKKAKA